MKVENFMLRNITLETRVHRRLVGEELIATLAVVVAMTASLALTFGVSLPSIRQVWGHAPVETVASVLFIGTSLALFGLENAILRLFTRP